MPHALRRFVDDITHTWRVMPRSQALRWYASILRHAPTVLRERKFYAADRDMHGLVRFFVLGHTFAVNLDSIGSTGGNAYAFLRELFVRQIYFRAFKALNFETCLDLGCNTGVVASVLRQLAGPQGRVVGIDPLTYPDNTFRSTIDAGSGTTLHQGVLCGESLLNDPPALEAMCAPYDFDPALAISVDQLRTLYALDHIDFLKMDVEGAEFAIFRDSTAWLRGVDNLAMEVHTACGDPSEIIVILRASGFQCAWLDDAGYATEPAHAGYIYASRTGSLAAAQ